MNKAFWKERMAHVTEQMQDVEYRVWSRAVERHQRGRSNSRRLNGTMPGFSMAFQPIVDLQRNTVFAYESLVRSLSGESAFSVLASVPGNQFFLFDKKCRSKGIQLAMQLGLVHRNVSLSINVNSQAATAAASHLHLTCSEAMNAGFPMDRLILEFVEDSEMADPESMRSLMREYQEMGVRIAIDDFGAGYSGLSLLANLRPDIVKLDMSLVSKVDQDRGASVVLSATIGACRELGVEVIAEGVECPAVMKALLDMGVVLQQGYLFARPGFEVLPEVDFTKLLSPQ